MNNEYCVMCGSYHPLTTNGCGVVVGNVERDYDSWRGGNAIFRPNGNVDEIATAVAYAKSRESAEIERLSKQLEQHKIDDKRRAKECLCFWCGEIFPMRRDGTKEEKAGDLTAHAMTCVHNPCFKQMARAEAAESKLSQLQLSNETDRLLEKVSDYRSGYSCGYSDAKNGTRMRDKDAATAFFGLDAEGSIPDILNGGQQ